MPAGDLRHGPDVMDKQTIAILPFKNMSSDPENEYFADGITEELIIALSTIDRLKVISRTSAMQYKTSSKGVIDIARELAADTLVEGSVRKATNRVRISVQLIDGRDEGHLWAQTYDRQLDDIFAVQSEIAEKIVEGLRVKLQESERRNLRKSRTSSSEAYTLYLKGRYHLTRYSEGEVRKAAELFAQATKIDDQFASAYAMSAQCEMFLGFFGFVAPSVGFAKARPLLRRAIEIDDHLDIAHMLMGRLLMDADWDWPGAEAEFRRVIEMSPNSAEAHYRYALLLLNLLRNSEALAEIKTAEELDPLSVAVNQVAGSILFFSGRTREAIGRLERAIEIDPQAAFAHDNLGLARCQEGNADEGIAEIKKAMELDPNNVMFMTDLCYAYASAGRSDEAKMILARVEADERSNGAVHVPPVALAGMYACLGETDRALEWLQKAYSEHSPYLCSLKVERWFEGIRADPRFVALLERVGLGRKAAVVENTQTITSGVPLTVSEESRAERLASNLMKSGYHRVEDKLPVVLGEIVSFRMITYNEDTSQYIVCDFCDQATKATVERLLDKMKLLARSNFDYKVRLGILLSDRDPPNEVKEYAKRLAGARYPLQVVSDPDKMSELVP
ncbi:MAG: tetratricopeptide repeat protein [Thaumarchaeota archaeon]|nr:tetratricopeptide repeat protein [Nitrososphaerota archaeon]